MKRDGNGVRIGIDLGGSNIAAGLLKDDGGLAYKCKVKTDTSSESAVLRGLADVVFDVTNACGIEARDIDSIGVACPGAVDSERGVVEYSANLPLCGADIRTALSSAVNVDADKVRIANDADAAALGEYRAGVGKGTENFMLVTLGTGVGAGCICGGRMLSGRGHSAGELGHTVIVYGGEQCACGRRGCAERYCSASALKHQTKDKIEACERDGIFTSMKKLVADNDGRISARTAFIAAADGDVAAREVVNAYISYLSCMLTNFINIFAPEVLAIGGGVSGEGERLLAPLRERVYGEMYDRKRPREMYTRIECAALGNDAGIVGAAMI